MSGLSGVVQRTAMLKYYGSINYNMGRCDLVADGSTAAGLTTDDADVGGAINSMKSLYVDSAAVKCRVCD